MSSFVTSELVWVKLGGVQWPAVVKDKADCDEFLEALKRDPIVVVEFFDKKLHDVYNESHLCRYNCEEKEDIIQKSLQFTRKKPDIADNFKKDVITAEKISDGDVHILSKAKFVAPIRQKHDDLFGKAKKSANKPVVKRKPIKLDDGLKRSKYSDIFPESVSKSKKPTPKLKKPSKPASESPRPDITHPRFVVENDHQIRILAPKVSEPSASPSASTAGQYKCHQCSFTTARLNVLVLHNKTHIAAAAAKLTPAKRKTPDSRSGTPTKKPKKAVDPNGSPGKSKPSSSKTDKTSPKKTSHPSTPAKNAAGEAKKAKKTASSVTATPDKPKPPVKISPLKPVGSSKPLLIDDWEEDDDEEVAERLKIQSEIDRFINGRRSADGTRDSSILFDTTEDESFGKNDIGISEPAAVKAEVADDRKADDQTCKPQLPEETEAAPGEVGDSAPVATATEPTDDAVSRQQRELQERNDALLQAAVEDVLADTAPVQLPSLPTDQPSAVSRLARFDFVETPEDTAPVVPPRPRPVRLCAAVLPHMPPSAEPAEVVTSSAGATPAPSDASPTALPPNLQILSVPGADGQPDTYVLVSVDDKGNVQTVNPGDSLRGLGPDTLLAYEVVQDDGTTRTAYLNPSALSTSADIKHLLAGDGCKVESSTPLPDSSSGK